MSKLTPPKPIQRVRPWRKGEPLTAARANQTVEQLNRLVAVVAPPRQSDVPPVGGGATVGVGDPLAVGYIRFFSS